MSGQRVGQHGERGQVAVVSRPMTMLTNDHIESWREDRPSSRSRWEDSGDAVECASAKVTQIVPVMITNTNDGIVLVGRLPRRCILDRGFFPSQSGGSYENNAALPA